MIQRYEIDAWGTDAGDYGVDVDPDKYGEWVKFSDLKAFASSAVYLATMGTAKDSSKLFDICYALSMLTGGVEKEEHS